MVYGRIICLFFDNCQFQLNVKIDRRENIVNLLRLFILKNVCIYQIYRYIYQNIICFIIFRDDPLPFEGGKNCFTIPGLKPGMISLEELCEKAEDMKYDEDLKSYGLSEEEIGFYKDCDKGMDHMKATHKNIEETVLHQMIKNIRAKVEHGKQKLDNKRFFHTYQINTTFILYRIIC